MSAFENPPASDLNIRLAPAVDRERVEGERCRWEGCCADADVDFGYPDEPSRSTRWAPLCWEHAAYVDRRSQVSRREIRFTTGRPATRDVELT